jgi:general secretion pathway protein L
MRETLVIRLGSDPDQAEWLSVGATGCPSGAQRGPLAQAARQAAGRRVVALVAGTDVLLTRAELPGANRRRMLQALPYALEERLAGDVEQLHFAAGGRESDNRLPVAVVARERMNAWCDALQRAGLHPQLLISELQALPWEADGWTVLLSPERALVRTGPAAGFAIEPDNLLPLARLALRERIPASARLLESPGCDAAALCTLLEQSGVSVHTEPAGDSPLGAAPTQPAVPGAIDLLQGEYSRREQLGRRWRPWVPAAALLLVWLGVQAGITATEYRRLAAENEALAAATERVFRDAFPEVRRIVNPRVQMERGIEELAKHQAGGGFLELFEAAGGALAKIPGLQIQGVAYRDGQLDLDVSLGDLQILDRLKQQLDLEGLAVEIQSASAGEGGVRSRMRLRKTS